MGLSRSSISALPKLFSSVALFAISNLLLAGQPASQSQQTSQPPSIQLRVTQEPNPFLHLEARQAPLGQILKAIADKTGAQIHYSVLPEAPVTATCIGKTVQEIMDCLVGKQIGMVAHKPTIAKLAEFWLLGSSVGSCQAVTVTEIPNKEVKHRKTQETPESIAEKERMIQEQTDLLLKQYESKDPSQRAEAIGNLSSVARSNNPDVEGVLHNALNDQDATVREQAISTIIRRGGNVDSELGKALRDSNNNVRFAAVSGINDDVVLLQQALNDTEPSVRDLAKSKLESIAAKGVDTNKQ
ncbi:MAG: HEAT repeat domain-containing protein [Methylococcaceae bacterium]|nr:HEAT repeat domain-containing protein [Methylococcaceae bacterium]